MEVLVASRMAPWGVGGLENYLAVLASATRQAGVSKMHFLYCPFSSQTIDTTCESYDTCRVRAIKPWVKRGAFSMASRRLLHGALEAWMRGMLGRSLSREPWLHSVDSIHFVGTGWDLSGFMLLEVARCLRIPFTVWPAVHPESWGDDAIDMRLYRLADSVFCQTTSESNHLAKKGVERERISLCGLPPNVPTNGNGPALRHRIGIGKRPAVLFLGRRDEGKGYHALLKAWPVVIGRIPDAVLLLAGKGGEGHDHLLRALPTQAICDLGIVDDATKADVLAACDILCLPSAHESFGIVYVEAWSYAKPVICGTAPACRELIRNGVTGLHASQDPDELASAISRLLGNPSEAKSMGENGLRLQREKFTIRRLVECHLNAWNINRAQRHKS